MDQLPSLTTWLLASLREKEQERETESESERERERREGSQDGSHSLFMTILKATSCKYYSILFVRGESV